MIALDRPIVRWFRGHSHNCPKLTVCLFNLVLSASNYFMIKISKLSQNTTNKEIKTYQLIKTSEYLLHWYWDLCTEILLNKNSDSNLTNRDHERQNFIVKKYRWSNQQCDRKNFNHDWAMSHKKETRALKKERFNDFSWQIYFRTWK